MSTNNVPRKWNPVQEPFRVTHTYRGPSYPSGWLSHVVGTYATLEEALDVARAPFPAGVAEARVCEAYGVNERGWVFDDGRSGWKRRAFRKRKAELQMSRGRR